MKFRAERIVKVYGKREQPPEVRLRDKDKRRSAYYRFYTNMKWGHAQNYHLTLDSGVWGLTSTWILSQNCFDKLSNETHFVGLSFEKAAVRRSALAYARTFASRKVFSPTRMSPEKMVNTLFAPAGANSARLFDRLWLP